MIGYFIKIKTSISLLGMCQVKTKTESIIQLPSIFHYNELTIKLNSIYNKINTEMT